MSNGGAPPAQYGVCHTHRVQWLLSESGYCPKCIEEAAGKVPRIVKDFEAQIVPDIKGVAAVAKEVFFGDFFQRHGFVRERGPVTHTNYQPSAPAPPTVIDVEPACQTCGGTKRVGASEHEVPCPACTSDIKACPTCLGAKLVGARGYQVRCPVCDGCGTLSNR